MKILFLGDVVGSSGRKVVKNYIDNHQNEYDFIIANIENSASGFGITERVYKEFSNMGIHAMTGGNHTWDKKGTDTAILEWNNFLRPANLSSHAPGIGFKEFEIQCESSKNKETFKIVVISLIGRVFMQPSNDPFEKFNEIYELIDKNSIIIVDFHGEATSEKKSFAHFVDGRAHGVFGTHTHVQTNDLRLLPKGTLYLTDAGMNGAYDSILGMEVAPAVDRFTSYSPRRLSVETNPPFILSGVSFNIEKNNIEENLEEIGSPISNSQYVISVYKLVKEIFE